MNISPDQILQVAVRAAEKASRFILEESKNILQVDFKGATDMVTQADRGSEEIIINEISLSFPDHNILAEESCGKNGKSPYTWIIDPLDGTTNYVHNYPFFSVSIAIQLNNRPLVSVVSDVYHHHIYSAISGQGAFRNEKLISISNTNSIEHSLLSTGFPYIHNDIWSNNMVIFRELTDQSQGVRRSGSASIDLCHVACGWLDGFWEMALNPWDTAAGILIVEEAGGKVTRMDGKPFSISHKQVLATNGHLHDQMVDTISNTGVPLP